MLKVYGKIQSRAARTLWLVEEIGIPYEWIPIDYQARENRDPEYLAVNPMGRIPAIDDDGLKLAESMAINLYLARKHADRTPVAPRDLTEEGRCLHWSLFALGELETHALTVLFHGFALEPERRDADKFRRAIGALQPPLEVIEATLAGGNAFSVTPGAPQDFLIGDRFTVADLNVAAILDWARGEPTVLDRHPGVRSWLERCYSRDAYQRIRELRRVASGKSVGAPQGRGA